MFRQFQFIINIPVTNPELIRISNESTILSVYCIIFLEELLCRHFSPREIPFQKTERERERDRERRKLPQDKTGQRFFFYF